MSLTIPKLQQLCDEARCWFNTQELIIAGGAPRDLLSGVPVKDIDIFVRTELEFGDETSFTRSCKYLAEILGGMAEFRPAHEDYGNLLDLCDITDGSTHGLIQVIGIDRCPVNDVHSYDFGLSQVFVTPAGLFFTEKAIADRAAKTITHVPTYENEAGFQRSKARLARLREKYEGWTFVNCEALEGDHMPQQREPIYAAPEAAELPIADADPESPHVSAYWTTFDGRPAACVEAAGETSARQLARELTGFEPVTCVVLPYPARPRLNPYEHPTYGICPAFCFKPEECAGNSACPQSYSCTE